MQLPEALLHSLEGIEGFDQEAFKEVHESGKQITSIRINPFKISDSSQVPSTGGDLGEAVPWTEYGYYLQSRPSFTFDPLFHAGCYYVQEASSMFLEQALKQTVDLSKPLKVLDLCAAPGGKSTHIQSLLSKDSLLVSNEVIRSRVNVLKDNIIKWGCENVVVTNNDPNDFAKLENYFDVIVVDAPCSGSGLFRRDADAIEEWNENNVQLCSQRQQRILADVWPSLKKDGILVYSTCSYSKEEDEDILNWVSKELAVDGCPLAVAEDWKIIPVITDAGLYGYRFWPDKVKGEGFFLACFKKTDGEAETSFRLKNKPEPVTKKELPVVERWTNIAGKQFIKHNNTVYAWPENQLDDFTLLLNTFKLVYSGTLIGEFFHDKLVPDHALAMSLLVNEHIVKIELSLEQAIQYLQRKDLQLQGTDKGWQLVCFNSHPLGWINVLHNRVNNYYPKELRILKDN